MSNEKPQEIKIVTADPSALGLLGLSMVTLVASTQKLEWTEGLSYIIPWAIFLGAFAQLLACVLDSKKNNVFGTTAFGAYGFFWLGVAASWLIKLGVFGEAMMKFDTHQLGVAFIGYLIFSLFMTVAAAEINKVLFIILLLIDVLFIGLSLSTLGIAVETTHALAGWAELVASLFGFYGCGANVINHQMGRVVLPVGKPLGIFKK